MSNEPHCLKCAHCHFSSGSPGFSDMTPGTGMSFGCYKMHWNAENLPVIPGVWDDRKALAIHMSKADRCPDYTPDA